jgi:hypothetical protein
LPDERLVGLEAEPFEILENRPLVLGPASLPIVILDPKQDLPAACLRNSPDLNGVDDVADMEETGRRWRESADHH